MFDIALSMKLFAGLFALMSPLSVIPIFLALTAGMSAAGRRRTVISAIATVTIGALFCSVAGHRLLDVFGIDVAHFRLAGGVIVLMIALTMLNGDDSPAHRGSKGEQKEQDEEQDKDDDYNPGIYPIGLPISLGPGTIALIIVFAQQAKGTAQEIGFYAGLIAYLVFFAAFLWIAPWIGSRLSPTALSVSKRLMGMILAAIAMEMIGGGLSTMFPNWVR